MECEERVMEREEMDRWAELYRRELFDWTLPFWLKHGVDGEYGGLLTCLDRDGTIIDSDKGVWQQGRFAWLMGELYNTVEPRPEWLRLARSAADFLTAHAFDPGDGRMWFQLTREGKPLRKRRYAFSESFAAIAYGELFRAAGDPEDRRRACAAFERFVHHDQRCSAAKTKFTEVRPTRGLAVPMITIATAQELRDSVGLPDANAWIDHSIDVIQSHHVHAAREAVLETVARDGRVIDHLDGRTLNPGHAIEAAWFILEEARQRRDVGLRQLGCRMLDWMWRRGWDAEHGGILYFVGLDERPVQEYWHDMKFWWPQNETIIATLLAYELTGEARYLRWHRQIRDWAWAHFPDREHGEWFGYLHRDGSLSQRAKGNLWKGPFHLPRMLVMLLRILERIRKQGVAAEPERKD